MRTNSMKFRIVAWIGLLATGLLRPASADTINFDNLQGPSVSSPDYNAQTLNISTSVGNVEFQGGAIYTETTFLIADPSSVYGTTGNGAVEQGTGSGFTNPLTISFPVPVQNFFLYVFNGLTTYTTYTLADNDGNSATFTLPPNFEGGEVVIGFAPAGNIITVTSDTGAGAPWDFQIDNVSFNEPLRNPLPGYIALVPEPGSIVIVATAFPLALGYWWHRRRAV